MSERTDKEAPRLLPVTLPDGVTDREAAEFEEGLATLDQLVARLRAYAEKIDAPDRSFP